MGESRLAATGRLAGFVAKALLVIVATPVVALVVAITVYDLVAIRPYVGEIEAILAAADPQDANPPALVRAYIDAGEGSPDIYAVRLVTHRLHPEWRTALVRRFLWQELLPLHLDDSQMYGLFATLAFNGSDYGLSNFARREFGRPLDELTPREAATTVAITKMPSGYLRNRERLAERATLLMDRVVTSSEPASPAP